MRGTFPRILTLSVLALCAAAWLPASDIVGETSYLDGSVDVYRAGAQLTAREVGIGAPVENYDILRTGIDGTIEVTLTAGASPESTLRVEPNTSFTVEVGMVKGQPKTTVNMITGTLSLKVKKIAGAGAVEVKTESAIMGVRGTAFSVTTPPSGDILVTCSEGEVACVDEGGAEVRARPGTAVEKIAGEMLRAVPVAVSSLATYQQQWLAERIEALRSNALRATQGYATRYNDLLSRFNTDYQALMQQADILNDWATEDQGGQVSASISASTMAQKKRIIGSLLKLRSTLFVFERVYFRLIELEQYHRDGVGRGKLASGESTEQFFSRIAAERVVLAKRLSRVQYAARLYAARNGGEFPASLLGSDGSSEDFENADEFFDDSGDW